jgi:ketosteroid isomerase-like protein
MDEKDIAAWIDKQAIQELVVRYSDAASRGAWEEFGQCWTADAIWEVAPPVDTRVEGRRAIVDSVIANTETADFLLQMTHGAVVTLHGAGRASSRTTIHAIARTGTHNVTNYAIYCDEVVKTDGVWQFSLRRLQNIYYDPRPLPGMVPTPRADLAKLR